MHRKHEQEATRIQRLIDALTAQLGRPAAIITVVLIVGAWIGAVILSGGAETAAFAWLELSAALSGLLVALLILVTQRREDVIADRRARLILELALLADAKTAKVIALLEELRRDQPGVADRVDHQSEAMSAPTDPKTVMDAIDAQT